MKTTWLKLRRALELCDDPPVTQLCTKSSGTSEKETETEREKMPPIPKIPTSIKTATNQNNLPNASVSVPQRKTNRIKS